MLIESMINAQSAGPFSNSNSTQPAMPNISVRPPEEPAETTVITSSPQKKSGMSRNMKMIIAGILLLIVVVGSGVGYLLTQQQQDLRQQADEIKPSESPIVRPPETVAPTSSAVCTKTAYLDPGPGPVTNLVETTSFNSSQGIMFRIAVTKNDDRVIPLSISDDFTDFTKAGYEFVSAETGSAHTCRPDDGYNRDNPGYYKCDWLDPQQGQTLVLYVRLRPTTNYLVEPEKISATNRASVDLCELCGGGALQDGEVAGRNAPTGTSSSCPVTVMIPGNTGTTPPTSLSCNSACSLVDANDNPVKDPCATALGNGYACTQVIDRPASSDIPTHRCRLVVNPTEESCKAVVTSLTCNSICTPSLTNTAGQPDSCSTALGNAYGCVNVASNNDVSRADYRCRLKSTPTNVSCQTTTATPTIGCNQTCSTNADCSNPDHVCSTQEGSKLCRLSSNQGDSSCATGTTTTTTTTPSPTPTATTSTGSQPTLPAELPQTGPDMSTWFKAGLGALGLGVMFLLLL